jgi:putative transcriptional regulator
MLKNNLSKLMGEKKVKITELHRLTGLSRNTLTKLYYEKTDYISFKTIEKLCWALDCNTQELLEYIPDD